MNILVQGFVDSGWSINEFVQDWAQTQLQPISAQLELGARYLDFRPAVDILDGEWKICHAAIIGGLLEPLLIQIADFLEAHPSEFVILAFSNFRNEVGELKDQELIQMLGEIFGGRILEEGPSLSEYRVGQMVDSGKQILIIMDTSSHSAFNDSPLVWTNFYSNLKFNSYANSDSFEYMTWFNRQMVSYFKSGVQPDIYMPQVDPHYFDFALFIISWTQTESGLDVVKSVVEGERGSILDYSREAMRRFGEFYEEVAGQNEYPVFGNIFIIDFLNADTCEAILIRILSFPNSLF